MLATDEQIRNRITCERLIELNGGAGQRAAAAIKDAYERDALYLDGNSSNGIPCDSYGYPFS